LQVGRHFRLTDGAKVIVGRNMEDNRKLENLVREDDTVMKILNYKGPYVVLSAKPANGGAVSTVVTAARIAARYASSPEGAEVEVECIDVTTNEHEILKVLPFSDDVIEKMRV
jgi:predicted ribosome quality control (RQC) complex YloA/Tae2 family protein